MNEKVGTVRRRGGRSSRVRAAVLAAARERLLARGYSALSVRDVAKVAGVAPTTVYRHWPTVADLASAAMTDLVGSEDIVPDTGSLERDLRALLEKVARMLSQPEIKRILRAVIAIDDTTATASTLRQQLWRNRTEGASIIIDRAVMRSELPAGTDAEALLETMIAPLYLRVLLDIGPLDQAVIDRVIHAALAGR